MCGEWRELRKQQTVTKYQWEKGEEGGAACVNVYSSVEFDCTWKCLYASVEPKSSMMLCRLSFMAWKINFCLRFAAPSSCNAATKLKRFRRKLT